MMIVCSCAYDPEALDDDYFGDAILDGSPKPPR